MTEKNRIPSKNPCGNGKKKDRCEIYRPKNGKITIDEKEYHRLLESNCDLQDKLNQTEEKLCAANRRNMKMYYIYTSIMKATDGFLSAYENFTSSLDKITEDLNLLDE